MRPYHKPTLLMKIEKTNTITINDQRLVVTKVTRQPLQEYTHSVEAGIKATVPKTAFDITLISDSEDREMGSLELTAEFTRALSDALEELL